MIYVLSWSLVGLLLALWSLTAWALHGVAHWVVSNAGALSGAASGIGPVRLPEALAVWVPPGLVDQVSAWAAALAPAIDSVLQAIPMLAGGITVAAWIAWAIGSLFLLMVGFGLHALATIWRRQRSSVARDGQPAVERGLVGQQ